MLTQNVTSHNFVCIIFLDGLSQEIKKNIKNSYILIIHKNNRFSAILHRYIRMTEDKWLQNLHKLTFNYVE